MSNRGKCVTLPDDFSEAQPVNVAAMLQNMKQAIADAMDYNTPNAATVAAIQELENSGGEVWTGSTKDFFAMLDAEDNVDIPGGGQRAAACPYRYPC